MSDESHPRAADEHTTTAFRFDRGEWAGALGDLGTLLPIGIGLILVNHMDSTAIFTAVAVYYLLSGLYFRTTMPVQPMKAIGAYAVARALEPVQVTTAGLWMGVILAVLALSGAITLIGRVVPKAAIRGVQISTGVLLGTQGVLLMTGGSALQHTRGAAEPYLSVSHVGPLPIGLILGIAASLVILLLAGNRRFPAALVVVTGGALAGLLLGAGGGLAAIHLGLHVPSLFPYGLPDMETALVVLAALALPQLPMTLGNAVVAQADLSREYFGPSAARRSTPRALAISMSLANIGSALIGGMPLCHGAGGLAAHYRFGARTAGSNLIIGAVFLFLALLIGDEAMAVATLLPLAVLGALLIFAGLQLALVVRDLDDRAELFVALSVLAVTLATNLGVGFLVGVVLAAVARWRPLQL